MSFVFVNFSTPEETDHGSFKKQVRSAAAAYSHRTAPRRGLKATRYQSRAGNRSGKNSLSDSSDVATSNTESSGKPSPPESSDTSRSSASPKHGKAKAAKRVKTESAPGGLITTPLPRSPSPYSRSHPHHVAGHKTKASPHHVHSPKNDTGPCKANVSRKRSHSLVRRERSVSRPTGPFNFSPLPDPCYMDATHKDPFETYPVPYQPWYTWLLDFWYIHILPKARSLVKLQPQTLSSYILWSRRFELTEPALFYTSVFLATGIPVANGQMHVEKALWLRGQAVRALNEALDDPDRAISNAMISAVGKIALHEFIYGDRQAAIRIHRPAQQRMIAMRGGIEKLGFPVITLQLMTWYDALMAAESGTIAYFKDVPKKLAIASYTEEEAVRVTNESSPHRKKHPGYGTMETPKLSEGAAAPSVNAKT